MATNHTVSKDNYLLRKSPSSSFTITIDINGINEVTVDPHGTSKSNTKGLRLKENWKRAVEVLVLSGVILLVCGLFTIPTILYALPPLQVTLNQVLA
jgi:hypothetical protein